MPGILQKKEIRFFFFFEKTELLLKPFWHEMFHRKSKSLASCKEEEAMKIEKDIRIQEEDATVH